MDCMMCGEEQLMCNPCDIEYCPNCEPEHKKHVKEQEMMPSSGANCEICGKAKITCEPCGRTRHCFNPACNANPHKKGE